MGRILRVVRGFGAITIMTVAGLAGAQRGGIVIQVLNGKNGQPIANEHLVVFTGASVEDVKEQKNHVEVRTDAKGEALLSVDTLATSHIQVWVDWHVPCQEVPNSKSYSVEDILKNGSSTSNNCGPVKHPLSPNHFVVFARPAHFWEKMRQ
jgi:hypothetical protein